MDERKEILKDLKFLISIFVIGFAIYVGIVFAIGISIIKELEKLNEQTTSTNITHRS